MDKIETQDIQCEHPLTCKQFIKQFNAISENYVADTYMGYVDIYDVDSGVEGVLDVARLDSSSWYWLFECERPYSWEELMLMAKLAANPPMFRNPKEEDDAEN
ncbi:hypothetical protein [Lactobacillus delbrueckii]|uniref:hypothetical protein n=1 Tax=Lactobacillus delbrueckii TaxID=1584 RepID=UPI0022EBB3F9|nr:hypothetical protein [Lactobacillus delbrueckii]MDA3784982.1 hypothetical protein [Lactobacillus delbrueckii]MDA3797281.1 hypothetical protein [Lactobacillus delbrueckii]